MTETLEDGKFPYLEMVAALSSHDTAFLAAHAGNPECPEGFFALLCAESPEVQLSLATNPRLVDPYASHLIVSGGEDMWVTLLGNEALVGEHLRMILDRAPGLLFAVLAHRNAPTDLLNFVYQRECENGRNEAVATAVVTHKNVPFGLLIPAFRDYPSLRNHIVEAFLTSSTYAGLSEEEMRDLIMAHPEYQTAA